MRPSLLNKFIFRFIVLLFAVIPVVGLGQTYSTPGPGTYVVPAGVTCLQVQIWGGGGAGGSNNTTSNGSGGGGGGGYTFALISVTPGQNIAYTVGAGGAPVVTGGTGGAGGTSTFGAFSAGGGGGGAGNGTLTGGAAGTGSTYNGGAGGNGRSNTDGDAGGGGSSAGTGSVGTTGNNFSGSSPGGTAIAPTGGGNGGAGGAGGNGNDGVSGSSPGGGGGGGGDANGANVGVGGSGGNGQIIVTPVNICDTYCTLTSNAASEYIQNVTFNTINNTTAGGGTGYNNYTSSCTEVILGSTYTLSVTIQALGTENVWAYFDWDSDGVFEAGELYDLGQSSVDGAILTANITIPAGATLGNTVMRIIESYNTEPGANGCTMNGFGESEDYCVTITGCTTTTPLAGADQNLLSCVNSTSLAGNAVGAGETGTWTLMSGSGTITSPNSPTSGVTNLGPGANVFRWTIQSANPACPDLYDEVTINTLNLSTVANAGVDAETCNTSFALSANAPGGGETGLWSVAPAGPTILPINSNTATISGMAPTTAYTLTWTITNGLCPSSDNVIITTIAGVTAANAGPDQSGLCTGSSINLAGNNPANGVGTWTGAGGIIADPSSPTTAVNALNTAGSYTYTWTVSAPGCVSSVDQVVLNVAFCDPNLTTVTCPGPVVFSDGGATYANNEHIVQKYCPSTPGQYITATFSQMTMSSSADHMIVLNGSSYSAPVIDDFYSLPTINGGANTITSSASDGCLTFIFLSNASLNAAGWTANITCTPTAGTGNVAECNATNCLGGCLRTICGVPATVPFTGDGVGAEELNAVDGGCLGAGETCSNWFLINPTNAGTLTLNMFVNAGQDQDFAVWEAYDPLLECPAMTGDAPIICNFAGSTAQGTGFNSVTQALPNPAYEPTLNISAAQITAGVYYIILVNTYNNGGACPQPDVSITFGGTAGLSCNPPIALGDEDILLAGSADGNMNHLTWQVEVETTISSYVLERSKNGTDWTTVGVRSSNKSSDGSEYFMYDESPYSPFTYYRVKGYNTNGEEKSSNIISISKGEMGDFWISELFPNPTSDEVSFQYQGKNFNEPVNVEIYNSIGQLVLTESIDVINQMSGITLRTEALAIGTYQVMITQGEQKMHKKLNIIR